MIFEITKAIEATLASLTNRTEKHGDDDKPAISMWFEAETDNTILDTLGDGGLRLAFYEADDKQEGVPGVPKLTTPNLRTNSIERLTVDQKPLEGWTLKVDHGIDETDPVTFGGCKVDGFQVTPKARATVILKWRVGTSDIAAESLGIIGMKVGQSVRLMLKAPKEQPAAKTTDKGAPLFDGDKPAEQRKPAAAERAAVAKVKGGTITDEAAWPFPKGDKPASSEAPPQSVTTEPVSTTRNPAQSRTARGRDRTKAALAAGQPS